MLAEVDDLLFQEKRKLYRIEVMCEALSRLTAAYFSQAGTHLREKAM